MIRVTIACPAAMIADANNLALCLGYSPDDGETYGAADWADAQGNRYAVASAIVSPGFPLAATAPLISPPWGADMEAAARAQGAISMGQPAAPDRLAVIIGDDTRAALAALGVTRIAWGPVT